MLTSAQLREKLKINQARLTRWLKEGLPFVPHGRQKTFDPAAVAAWIRENGKAQGAKPPAGTIATTRDEAARAINVSLRTLAEWLKDPTFPGKPGSPGRQDGYFPLEQIAAWREQRFGGDGRGQADGGELAAKRARKLDLQNDLLQVEVEKSLGSILDAEEMASFLERHVGVAKTILEQLADKVETRLPAKLDAKTRGIIRTAVDETVTEAFNAIAETMREDADDQDVVPRNTK